MQYLGHPYTQRIVHPKCKFNWVSWLFIWRNLATRNGVLAFAFGSSSVRRLPCDRHSDQFLYNLLVVNLDGVIASP